MSSGTDEPQRPSTKTPEPRVDQQTAKGRGSDTPDTPGAFPSFDWEDFEARYEKALADADEKERELLQEFEGLVKYFKVWASTSSARDNERAVKRLNTRQRYVVIAEENMAQKEEHIAVADTPTPVLPGPLHFSNLISSFLSSHSITILGPKVHDHTAAFRPSIMAAIALGQYQSQLAIPNISNDDLMSFFESHFSQAAVQSFKSDFFSPQKHPDIGPSEAPHDGCFHEEEEDDLGYYSDGVKRTLTDEQVAMFRHSEIEALKREKERLAERGESTQQRNLEAGEIDNGHSPNDAEPSQQPAKTAKNKKKRKVGKARSREPKPDLRKRTWDVVEAGLDTLDYD
ncbi:hypothetical protein CMUS01_04696 [Colletotrichum musicola]|uniref:Uncharacterized protein n=1 Tax=Colletotrichum musicola TaxID=2175873 RepID=A0A8H6KW91_9PEZI|nr:hypothetical protein CMUS01_04696 [Colletotrichum musicola]